MKFVKSLTSPIAIAADLALERLAHLAARGSRGCRAATTAEHFWPWYSNEPRTIAVATAAGSADGWARMKSLPPVSPTMRG